jgi:hypothetical protein
MDMYSVSRRQVGYQAAFASRLAPTRIGFIRKRQIGC